MSNHFWSKPLFWIGIYSVGYAITIIVMSRPRRLNRAEEKIPKPLMRVFMLLTFISPPIALPFTEGPDLTIPTPIALTVGIILLSMNFVIKILGQKRVGALPVLKRKSQLTTASVYGVVRHPLYMSNGLLAIGLAILLKSLYSVLFSVSYSLLYLLIIYFEEKDLLAKYGEEYEAYKKKVKWKLIPRVI